MRNVRLADHWRAEDEKCKSALADIYACKSGNVFRRYIFDFFGPLVGIVPFFVETSDARDSLSRGSSEIFCLVE